MTTISEQTVCVLVMSGLMGLFLLCMWWEARRALREMCDEERVLVKIESEQEFRRQMAREAARVRLNDLRAEMRRASLPSQSDMTEPEHIGRILDRLARIDTRTENDGVPELNFVRGGIRNSGARAPRKARVASNSREEGERGNGSALLATATR